MDMKLRLFSNLRVALTLQNEVKPEAANHDPLD